MRVSRLPLIALALSLMLSHPPAFGEQVGPAEWQTDPAFKPLTLELQEVAAIRDISEVYIGLKQRYPEAHTTSKSLRNMLLAQLQKGTRNLSTSKPQGPGQQRDASQLMPSVYLSTTAVADTPESVRSAVDARRSSYVELLKSSDQILEFSLISPCLLHQMGFIPDAQAFDQLLNHYKVALHATTAGILTEFSFDSDSAAKVDTPVTLVQLADKLDRLDQIPNFTEDIPPQNSWADIHAKRIQNLKEVYSADDDEPFFALATKLLASGEIDPKEVVEAASFKAKPISIVTRIYSRLLEHEKSRVPPPVDILNLIARSPLSDASLLSSLVTKYITSDVTPAYSKQLLASLYFEKETLTQRFPQLAPNLLAFLLGDDSKSRFPRNTSKLEPLARFIILRLTESGDDESIVQFGATLLERFIEFPSVSRSDESYAGLLLQIAVLVDDDSLMERFAKESAKCFTWPFEKSLLLLKQGKPAAADAFVEYGIQDNLFPIHPQDGDLPDLTRLAAAFLEKDPTQKNTYISLLLVESILRIRPGPAEQANAMEMLDEIITRWGSIDHPNLSLLQQGIRILWRGKQRNLEPAVPALRLWMSQNPIKSLIDSAKNGEPISDSKREVWRHCLNSGEFDEETTWLSDQLTETGIRGDSEEHARLSRKLVDVISLGSSSKALPEPLSNYYVFVRTWLMIHSDPSLSKQPKGWMGVTEELEGLSLSSEEIAEVIAEILRAFSSSNTNKGLSPIEQTGFLSSLESLENPDLETALLLHNWRVKHWIPENESDHEQLVQRIDDLLGNAKHREMWATLLFASASPASFKAEQHDAHLIWKKKFAIEAEGTWLEEVAKNYLESPKNRHNPILSALLIPEVVQYFDELPLGLRHEIATHGRLDAWMKENPGKMQTVLPLMVSAVCETIETASPGARDHELRDLLSIGLLPEIIVPAYTDNTPFFRSLYHPLSKAEETAISTHKHGSPSTKRALKPLQSLLLQMESFDDDLESKPHTELSPTLQLLSFLNSGNAEAATELIRDPANAFDFEKPSYDHHSKRSRKSDGKEEQSGKTIRRETIEKVLAGIPAELSDRRIFFKILTSPSFATISHSHLISRSAFPDRRLRLADPAPLLSEFDSHDFTEKELEKVCLRYLTRIRGAGRLLPNKLRRWKESVSWEELRNSPGFSSELQGYSDLVIFEGRHQEFTEILKPLLERKAPSLLLLHPSMGQDWAVIQWAIDDGLCSGDPVRESNCIEMIETILKKSSGTKSTLIQFQRKLLAGSALGYQSVRSPSDDVLQTLSEVIAMPSIPQHGPLRFTHNPIDHGLQVAGGIAALLSFEEKTKSFLDMQEVQKALPAELASTTFLFSANEAGLVSTESAIEMCKAQRVANPEDSRITLDLVLLLMKTDKDEEAEELFKEARKDPETRRLIDEKFVIKRTQLRSRALRNNK